MKVSAIITAGGTSSRFGKTNKLLEKVNGKTIIEHTIAAFLKSKTGQIIVCANASIITELEELLPKSVKIIEGGATRQQSVYNGLKECNCDYVLIHDGARPMITTDLINEAIEKVQEQKALTVAAKTVDTIKVVENGKIIKTLDRSKLYNTQTPQAFEYDLIKTAHDKLEGQYFTDDAGMLEYLNMPVYILEGDYKNIKITTQSDIEWAKLFIG